LALNGRLVVGFADPAPALPPAAGLDEWLVNTTTCRWRQRPDMAANVVLKFTSMNWTGDGRLVFWPRSPTSATWSRCSARPTPDRSARSTCRSGSGGSDSFVVW
jgi:hypothetical protein